MEDRKYRVNGLVIDTARYRVSGEAGVVPLEPKVFDLLVFLIRHRDRVLTRDEILDRVWGSEVVVDSHTVDNFIGALKKKLAAPRARFELKTVRGVGFRLVRSP
jgi:two-component system OmpR family response regulator